MKHFIITGLVLTALIGSQTSFAQNKQTFDDDIYFNSKSQPKSKAKPVSTPATASQQSEPVTTYSSSEGNTTAAFNETSTEEYQNSTSFQTHTGTYFQKYETGGYDEGEEYSLPYTTQINQFYHPWYDQPYWSTCYAPYGYGSWYAPGLSFGIGFGYGYSSMYFGFGYPYYPYYPYWGWGYPYYPYGGFYGGYYGGYGGYCGGYGGYYNSYPISYGPRYSSNTTRNDYAHGYRPTRNTNVGEKLPVTTPANTGSTSLTSSEIRPNLSSVQTVDRSGKPTVRTESHSAPVPVFNDSRNAPTFQSNQSSVNSSANSSFDRPGAASTSSPNPGYIRNDGDRNESANLQQAQPRTQRENRGFFGGGRTRSETIRATESAPRAQPSYSQPSYSQPRMERSASPRMAPSNSGSFGGGSRSGGGGGGGSFGGGMRGGGRR